MQLPFERTLQLYCEPDFTSLANCHRRNQTLESSQIWPREVVEMLDNYYSMFYARNFSF